MPSGRAGRDPRGPPQLLLSACHRAIAISGGQRAMAIGVCAIQTLVPWAAAWLLTLPSLATRSSVMSDADADRQDDRPRRRVPSGAVRITHRERERESDREWH